MKKIILIIGIIGGCAIAWSFVSSMFAFNTTVVLREIQAGKPIGILTILPMPIDGQTGRSTDPDALQARYVSLLPGGGSIPPGNAPAVLEASREGGSLDECAGNKVVSAKMMFRAFMPTSVTAEMQGQKVFAMTMGMYGVGMGGCKNTLMIPDPEYNASANPDKLGPSSILDFAGCTLRLFVGDPWSFNIFENKCSDLGFYPTQNWQDLGPTPDVVGDGIFVYCAYAGGLWTHSIRSVVAPEVGLSASSADIMNNPVYGQLCPPQ